MSIISVSGEPGCRREEVARLASQRLKFDLVTESSLQQMVIDEFGDETAIPDKAWQFVVGSILTRLATLHSLVVSVPGAELLFHNFPGLLRIHLVALESFRVGNLMIDHRLDRTSARTLLRQVEAEQKVDRRKKFRKGTAPSLFDMVLNSEFLDPSEMVVVLEAAVALRGLTRQGLLPPGAEAKLQFQFRLQLAKHGIAPRGKVTLKQKIFAHPSEEIFANLLAFYRIAWEYEPRSFPLQWDKDGKVLEAFTPDFYLPEFNLYVELTTMKQALVTRKNRKIKLLRAIYPHINIQVFYQKDIQNLIFKYGLAERAT